MRYLAFTDGAYFEKKKGNVYLGTWAYCIVDVKTHQIVAEDFNYVSGEKVSAQKMELKAFREALKVLPKESQTIFVGDCSSALQFYRKIINGNLEEEYKEQLATDIELVKSHPYIHMKKVQAHVFEAHGDYYGNNYVDILCQVAVQKALGASKEQVEKARSGMVNSFFSSKFRWRQAELPSFVDLTKKDMEIFYWMDKSKLKEKSYKMPQYPIPNFNYLPMFFDINVINAHSFHREELIYFAVDRNISLYETEKGEIFMYLKGNGKSEKYSDIVDENIKNREGVLYDKFSPSFIESLGIPKDSIKNICHKRDNPEMIKMEIAQDKHPIKYCIEKGVLIHPYFGEIKVKRPKDAIEIFEQYIQSINLEKSLSPKSVKKTRIKS